MLYSILISYLVSLHFAYIGPGAGAGTIAIVLGILGSVLLAIFSLFWYPFKRLVKRLRASAVTDEEGGPAN
jgi:hypothetical protein